jgi:hypothetical protein
MLKRTVVRLLLFGIPFGLSYWATRPVAPVAGNQTLVVCAYPGDRPGELRITLNPSGCRESEGGSKVVGAAVSVLPTVNTSKTIEDNAATTPLNIPF